MPNGRWCGRSQGIIAVSTIPTALLFLLQSFPGAIVPMTRSFAILLIAMAVVAEAFTSTAFLGSRIVTASIRATPPPSHRSNGLTMKVVDIDSEAAFDKTIANAGGALVVIDYSTTWCGYVSILFFCVVSSLQNANVISFSIHCRPCKVIAPKFEEFSEKYPDAVFLKVCTV